MTHTVGVRAGRDTTACLMSWFVYEMNRHPHVLAKVHEEIDAVGIVHDALRGVLCSTVSVSRFFPSFFDPFMLFFFPQR